MSKEEIQALKDRVEQLEGELQEREYDLNRYKNELIKANGVLEKLTHRVSQELDLVAQMQRWLVPTQLPNIPGFELSSKYLAGTQVGGDYIDVFETDDRFRFGVVVSASNGYSASSHFLSSFFKFSVDKDNRLQPPQKAVDILLKDMSETLLEDQEVHLFYALVDRRRYEMHLSLMGEIQALIWKSEKQELERVAAEQSPLSSSFSEEIHQHTVPLQEKDILIFCSPGIFKVRNMTGESFGSQRLYQSILKSSSKTPHGLRNEILYQVEKFVGSDNFPADMTVVVMEVGAQKLKLA